MQTQEDSHTRTGSDTGHITHTHLTFLNCCCLKAAHPHHQAALHQLTLLLHTHYVVICFFLISCCSRISFPSANSSSSYSIKDVAHPVYRLFLLLFCIHILLFYLFLFCSQVFFAPYPVNFSVSSSHFTRLYVNAVEIGVISPPVAFALLFFFFLFLCHFFSPAGQRRRQGNWTLRR
eukprot:gene7873-5500_t